MQVSCPKYWHSLQRGNAISILGTHPSARILFHPFNVALVVFFKLLTFVNSLFDLLKLNSIHQHFNLITHL